MLETSKFAKPSRYTVYGVLVETLHAAMEQIYNIRSYSIYSCNTENDNTTHAESPTLVVW